MTLLRQALAEARHEEPAKGTAVAHHAHGQSTRIAQLVAENQALRERVALLESTVEMLCTGLEWNIEHHPTVMDSADEEALREARAVLHEEAQA